MRILVTGGTGYLGRAIVERLAARGQTPVVFARRRATHQRVEGTASAFAPLRRDSPEPWRRRSAVSGADVETIEGDIRDVEAIARAVQGCQAVCHLAALVSAWQPRPQIFDEINVGGLHNVIAASERASVERLVCASSFLARPPADRSAPIAANDYQRSKVAADLVMSEAIARGLPLVRLYPGVIYGPGPSTEGNLVGRLVRDHLAGALPGLIGADRIWSFSFVADVADAFGTALERGAPLASYTLGGVNASPMQLFDIVRMLTGREVPRRIPFGLAGAIGLVEELRARATQRPPLVTRGAVEIFRHDWPLDSDDAIRDLGYHVRTLQEGVEALVGTL